MIKMELSKTSLFIQVSDRVASTKAFQNHKDSNQIKFFPDYKARPTYAPHCIYEDTDYICEIDKSCFYLLHLIEPKYLYDCFRNLVAHFPQKNESAKKFLRNNLENYDFRILLFKYVDNITDIYELLQTKTDVGLTLQELDVLIDFHLNNCDKGIVITKSDSIDLAEILIRYKLKHYSNDEIQDYIDRQEQLRIGEVNPTAYELKKDWIYKKVGNEITILGYKGEEQRIFIPKMLANGCKITKVDEYETSEDFDEFLQVNVKNKYIHSLMYDDNGIAVKSPGEGFFISDHLNTCKDWNIIEVHDPDFPRFQISYEELFMYGYSIMHFNNVSPEYYGLPETGDLYDYLLTEKHVNNDELGIFYPLDVEDLNLMDKSKGYYYDNYLHMLETVEPDYDLTTM